MCDNIVQNCCVIQCIYAVIHNKKRQFKKKTFIIQQFLEKRKIIYCTAKSFQTFNYIRLLLTLPYNVRYNIVNLRSAIVCVYEQLKIYRIDTKIIRALAIVRELIPNAVLLNKYLSNHGL